ncbi:MAG: HAD family hydrolase [Erysipelotrichaceae bacterium]|nr:HAD family hydrolase [Erysipelotrichaceae bacterium]
MTNKIAIMYDFDKTLCTKDMQEYGYIPKLGMDASTFWSEVSKQTKEKNMDPCLSYMYYMLKQSQKQNRPIKRNDLFELGKDIEFFPGVIEWFKRIQEIGNQYHVEIEHFIISSGLKEIIEGTSIASQFKKIYASEFHYNEEIADWPNMAVNYTNKTQFLFRINKGTLDIWDDTINEHVPNESRYIPYHNMIYIGDGMTDVPCMSLVKKYGGHSIAVFQDDRGTCDKLLSQQRVNFIAKADYREGSTLDTLLKQIIQKITLDNSLQEKHLEQVNQICHK